MTRLAIAVALLATACGDNYVRIDATVVGVARYEDRPPLESGALGEISAKPARGISVAVISEDDGSTLATAVTDDGGRYSLEFVGVSGDAIHVLAVASSTLASRPISVHGSDGMLHGFGGATIAAASVTETDLLITIESGEAQAFNAFDVLLDVMDRIPIAFGVTNPDPLGVFWERGSDDGTYFDGDSIHLLGAADDDDGFDDTVIIHESGHYVEDHIGRSSSPGGGHDGSPTNPTLAWSEGFATYFSMAVRDSPIYMDSNADGGWSYDGDVSITKANGAGAIGQMVSEDMVTEILWDMGDSPTPDDDPVAADHDAVLALQIYLKSAALRPVGKSGVDLVDSLDGWFNTYGLETCDAMRTIVTTTHTFPYDFMAAGGACP